MWMVVAALSCGSRGVQTPNGRVAVTPVEGAVADAPLRLEDKPRPQNDAYVNRRTSPPSTLNPFTTNEGDTTTISKYVLDRLIQLDPDNPPSVQPGLAVSWQTSDDGLTHTYTLRRGVQHADGTPFTSADVRFSFAVVGDPTVHADHLRSAFEDVVEVLAPDDHTVVVRMVKPHWKGLYVVGHQLPVLNSAWFQQQTGLQPGEPGFGDAFNAIRVPGPGTGPYTVQGDYDPDTVVLRQNPFSWQMQVRPTLYNFRELRWVFITDPVAAFEAFKAQRYDVTVVDFNWWEDQLQHDDAVRDIAHYLEYSHTGSGFSYVGLNTRQAPFDDPRVRLAMSHLVDRQWVNQELERGRGTPGVCPLKPEYPSYHPTLKPHPYDPERALELLAQAGWTDSDGDGVLDRDGQDFEFTLKLGSNRGFYQHLRTHLEESLGKVGIVMHTENQGWSGFVEDLYARRFQAVSLYASFADPWLDPAKDWHSDADVPDGGNHYGWHNPELDALLEAMQTNFDEPSRHAQMHEFCERFHADPPLLVLNHSEVGVLVHKRLRNAKARPTGLQIHEMWVPFEETLHEVK